MLPEDDRVIETCRSVLNVLMYSLDFLNNIYIYMCVCVCVCARASACACVRARRACVCVCVHVLACVIK